MKLRHLLILGVLLFMNGFVCTVLFLMVSREMARPAPTPTEAATVEPTAQPTFTATSTPTQVSTPTDTPGPAATYTPVVVPQTPAPTTTPTLATSTPTPPTSPPTVTPTSTSTRTSTPTAGPAYQYLGTEPRYENNCGTTWIEGTVWDLSGVPKNGVTVRCWTYGQILGDKVTPSNPAVSQGFYEFILHEQSGVPREVVVEVAVVDAAGNLVSPKIVAQTTATDCDNQNGRQKATVDFTQQY